MAARKEDFSTYETLVNIRRFSEHVYHSPRSQFHCSFHLKQCVVEARINWNENDWDGFSIVIIKIIEHDPEFKEVFESVIKYETNISAI